MRLILLKSVKRHSARIKIPPIQIKIFQLLSLISKHECKCFHSTGFSGQSHSPPPLLKRQLYSKICVDSLVVIARRNTMSTNWFMVYCCISGMFHFWVLVLSWVHPGKIPGVSQVLHWCFHDHACAPIVTFLHRVGEGELSYTVSPFRHTFLTNISR